MHSYESQFDPVFDVVRVVVVGTLEDHHMEQCIDQAGQFLKQTQCQKVLVDYREAQLMLSPTQSDARFTQFSSKVAISRRVALLYKSLGARQKAFCDRALQSGLAVGVFTSEWQALDWLLEAALRL